MGDVIQLRDFDPRARSKPESSAKVIEIERVIDPGERARILRAMFNRHKPVVVR